MPEYLQALSRSRRLYRNLMTVRASEQDYLNFLKHTRSPRSANFFVVMKASRELVGAINIENISRGLFQSATLGYHAFLPHAGKGLMREGLIQVIEHAFDVLRLHRLEANIQPQNRRSIALVESLGFTLEGYSPRFLKICGRWRDHERWAILREHWGGPGKLPNWR
jgi:ribosomal-protein-alanine N-acetyltransferase